MSQPSFGEIYEQVLVPTIFRPFALELLERAEPRAGERVLDLGCGTGIVARICRERIGAGANLTGVDVQSQMVAVARSRAPEIEWREANAMELPFDDGGFDLVLCQEMLQFVPDRASAVREMRRVLRPGGRLVLGSWRPIAENPIYLALEEAAVRHLGPSQDKRFSLGEPEVLSGLFADAGFDGVEVQTVGIDLLWPEVPVRLNVLASHPELATLSEAERSARLARVDEDATQAIQRFRTGDGFVARMSTNRVIAKAPA